MEHVYKQAGVERAMEPVHISVSSGANNEVGEVTFLARQQQ